MHSHIPEPVEKLAEAERVHLEQDLDDEGGKKRPLGLVGVQRDRDGIQHDQRVEKQPEQPADGEGGREGEREGGACQEPLDGPCWAVSVRETANGTERLLGEGILAWKLKRLSNVPFRGAVGLLVPGLCASWSKSVKIGKN